MPELLDTGPVFMLTVVILVAFEIIKGLVGKGLKAKEMAEEAVWKKGVTDSLSALMHLTREIEVKLDTHVIENRNNKAR